MVIYLINLASPTKHFYCTYHFQWSLNCRTDNLYEYSITSKKYPLECRKYDIQRSMMHLDSDKDVSHAAPDSFILSFYSV